MAANTEMSRAIGVAPIMRKNCTQPALPSTIFAADAICKPVFKKISTIGTSIKAMTKPALAGCCGWSLSFLPPASKSGTDTGKILLAVSPHQ